VFVLDSSGSIGRKNVEGMLGFLELLIDSLNVDESDNDHTVSRIGLLMFADSANVQFHLNTYNTRTDIIQAIKVQYTGGTTRTDDAIRYYTQIRFMISVMNSVLCVQLLYVSKYAFSGIYLPVHSALAFEIVWHMSSLSQPITHLLCDINY